MAIGVEYIAANSNNSQLRNRTVTIDMSKLTLQLASSHHYCSYHTSNNQYPASKTITVSVYILNYYG